MTLLALLVAATTLLDDGWTFCLGNTDPAKDFGHDTEYFTTCAKVGSADHNRAPAWTGFDDSTWQRVTLPHDWAVDLPFSADASHSHGYKCIGWKYPENSVGWYRRHFTVQEDAGQVFIEFDGIYRDSRVFCNGFLVGGEESGYTARTYDISDYVVRGSDNLLVVRCDASVEEGWFYEGAGIYRHVRLHESGPAAIEPYSLKIGRRRSALLQLLFGPKVEMEYRLACGADPSKMRTKVRYYDAEGRRVRRFKHLWSVEDPYLYTVKVQLFYDGHLSDECILKYGERTVAFDPEHGFLLNGKKVFLRGANMHQDHAGVGAGIPDGVLRYRVQRLKDFGFNAIRSSHNPASGALLDICDEMGMLVIDENRLIGSSDIYLERFGAMIRRGWNHPCIIAWSIGNEEWGGRGIGPGVVPRMVELAHTLDPSRPTTYGSSSESQINDYVDVPGYNYIVQNPVDDDHTRIPGRSAIGTEETTGCGTRGKSATDASRGWMASLRDTTSFRTGWDFYSSREWSAGVFYWTGFDYRGEPNPMKWPATGSQFGLFDYCGYPKWQAWELWGECRGAKAPAETVYDYPDGIRVVDLVCGEGNLAGTPAGGGEAVVYTPDPDYEILGWGNGDPGFKYPNERPRDACAPLTIYPFEGRAQVILRRRGE